MSKNIIKPTDDWRTKIPKELMLRIKNASREELIEAVTYICGFEGGTQMVEDGFVFVEE